MHETNFELACSRRLSSQLSCPDNDDSDADDDLDVVSNLADSCIASPTQEGVNARISESPGGHSSINGKVLNRL